MCCHTLGFPILDQFFVFSKTKTKNQLKEPLQVMGRTKQTAARSTGGKAPRGQCGLHFLTKWEKLFETINKMLNLLVREFTRSPKYNSRLPKDVRNEATTEGDAGPTVKTSKIYSA